MQQNNLDRLEDAIEVILAKESLPSQCRIRELIQQLRSVEIYKVDDDEVVELLARRLEERLGVSMTVGAVLKDRTYEPWLDNALADIAPYYWDRYKKLLVEKHFSGQVIATLDNVTDRTLGLLENPKKEGPWDRRGMVVGHVQSGKTANYTGLICKAADAGYQLIVVIAGIHNNLRDQTQRRIDEGFVGRDSAQIASRKDDSIIGAGKYDQTRCPATFTNSSRDFNKITAENTGVSLRNLKEPAVFVIKKNTTTLKNLIDWLKAHSAKRGNAQVDAPMLLIDDEADNASINIKHGKDAVSRINGQIRDLLQLFERSCYIGYTATPFANIFIDPDSNDEMLGEDLFPRNFIVSLDPPSNYFGATPVFMDETSSIVRHIEDNEDRLPLKHKIDIEIGALPESLTAAMKTFILAKAIRLARGHRGEHCSMLVNASRFTRVQSQLRNELHIQLSDIQSSLRVNGKLPIYQAMRKPAFASLHAIWEQEFSETGIDWPDVFAQLHDAAAPIKVVEVNSQSSGTLNYEDNSKHGLNIIAVGGFSLSRGLTLEGLMVSYFLRNSMMYDTLMQMGRWFGYRPGYDDLCRIWMPEEAEGWYAHISESIEMLRDELRRMEAAGATPKEFGLKVRSHPDTLIVTARNKIGSGERLVVNIGLANQFIETHTLTRSSSVLKKNMDAAGRLVENIEGAGFPRSGGKDVASGWLYPGIPAKVVKQFLSEFENHPGSMLTDSGPIRRYIEARESDELAEWDVLFTSLNRESEQTKKDNTLGISIVCQRRTAGSRSNESTIRITNKQRVSSRGVERTGLTKAEINEAESIFRTDTGRSETDKINYPDRIYRTVRRKPLLIIHLLDVKTELDDTDLQCPVVAWSISFPTTQKEEQLVEYVVNTTWLHENYRDDLEEDEMEGDDD